MAGHPIRVVFVLPALTAGGAERVLITLMNNIDRARFAPHMLCVNGDGPLRPLVDPAVPFTALAGHGLRVGRSLPRLYKALRRLKPDIVVCTMAHMNFGVLLLRPFFPRTHFIVREAVTPSFFFDAHKQIAAFLRTLYKTLYPLADRVISPAQAIIDEFAHLLRMDVSRHVCLPNPVDAEKIRGDGQAVPPPAPAGTVRFVAAGRLHTQKGFDRLLDILPRVPGDWHLTILGEGPEHGALAAQIDRLDLQDKVTLYGHAERPWPHFAAADAFLLPSRWEGLPNVALEALCCGTPVIATRESGGIAEIAAQAQGHVTLCRTMDEFADAMSRVTADNAAQYRPSLLPAAYERQAVIEKFSAILEDAVRPRA